MKLFKFVAELSLLVVATVPVAFAQQQFTQTVSRDNKNCNAVCSVIDIPELNGNPGALVFLKPVGNSATLNPHPIGAYFMYLKKWSVFNLDGAAITDGAKFSVEYFVNPDDNHFVYVAGSGTSCIDHAGLNGNSNAQVQVLPTSSPTRGGLFNKSAVKIEYDSHSQRWCVAGVNGAGVTAETAYNVAFSGEPAIQNANTNGTINSNPKSPVPTPTPLTPITTISPTGVTGSTLPVVSAGGDLSGFYPDPKVVGIQGRGVSAQGPFIGQVLTWNGTAWEPTDPVQSFYKEAAGNAVDIPDGAEVTFSDLTQTIIVAKKSRLVISAMIAIYGDSYGPGCSNDGCEPSNGLFDLYVNGVRQYSLYVSSPGKARQSFSVSNFMMDVFGGTYNITFAMRNTPYSNTSRPLKALPSQSSVLVLPIK